MNRQSRGLARSFVSLSVFALLSMAVIAAETKGDRADPADAYTQLADPAGNASLIARLVGLAGNLRAGNPQAGTPRSDGQIR
jgi:hypothetical protein